MIHSFSGDPFLAARAARAKLAQLRSEVEFTELTDELTPEKVQALAGQAGLFGAGGLYLDFDSAFSGQAGVKPRNALLKSLAQLPADSVVIVLDSSATEARQKQWRALGEHEHQPTPRFGALNRWVAAELKSQGVRFERDVPALLAELFGEDLPAIAAEAVKLSLVGRELSAADVRELTGKDGVTDSFRLIDALIEADTARALLVCRALARQAEDAVRVLAAITWQFSLVSRCVGLLAAEPRASEGRVASVLKVKPFVAGKVRRVASRLDEARLLTILSSIAAAELAGKTGRDPEWALEKLTVELSQQLA